MTLGLMVGQARGTGSSSGRQGQPLVTLRRYSTSEVYKGYFQEGLRHGFGVLESTPQTPQPCRYTGHWERGQRSGYGVQDDGDRRVLCGPVPGLRGRGASQAKCLRARVPCRHWVRSVCPPESL